MGGQISAEDRGSVLAYNRQKNKGRLCNELQKRPDHGVSLGTKYKPRELSLSLLPSKANSLGFFERFQL